MRILVGGFHLESNSFSAKRAEREEFSLIGPDELLEKYSGKQNKNIKGIIDAITDAGGEVVPSWFMSRYSGGLVGRQTIMEITDRIAADYALNQPIDAIFLDLHGGDAMVGGESGSAYILKTLREYCGDKTVIVNTTDMHADITDEMTANSNMVAGYHTYPHTDYYATGYRAAALGMRLLKGEELYQARVRIPMIIPAEGYNSNTGCFAELTRQCEKWQEEGKFVDFTISQMQPWLDVKDAGGAVLVVDKDKDNAAYYAKLIAHKLFDLRKEMDIRLYSVAEIEDAALQNDTGVPVILVDSADSPNAGSAADSAYVLEQLIASGKNVRSALLVTDAAAAAHAFEVGIGNEGEFTLGGRLEPRFHKPFTCKGYVRSLHDGKCLMVLKKQNTMPPTGPTAVIQVGNVDVIVTSRPGSKCYDPRHYRQCGLEPLDYQLIMVKSANQYKVGFDVVSTLGYPADTPGPASANLAAMPFENIPRPFYPMDDIDTFDDTVSYARK